MPVHALDLVHKELSETSVLIDIGRSTTYSPYLLLDFYNFYSIAIYIR